MLLKTDGEYNCKDYTEKMLYGYKGALENNG